MRCVVRAVSCAQHEQEQDPTVSIEEYSSHTVVSHLRVVRMSVGTCCSALAVPYMLVLKTMTVKEPS